MWEREHGKVSLMKKGQNRTKRKTFTQQEHSLKTNGEEKERLEKIQKQES